MTTCRSKIHLRTTAMRTGLRSPIASCLALCVATVALPTAAFGQVPPPPTASAPPAAPAAAPAAAEVFPPPEDAALSEDAKPGKAKELYIEAEGLAENGDYTTAAPLYERAYFLMPGKHGFAYKVGYAAYSATPRDCNKADEYLKHYLQYADPAKHPEWQDESKRIIGEISVSGCATPKAAPVPVDTGPAATEPDPEPTQGEEVIFESAEDRRAREAAAEEQERDAGKKSGMFKGGVAMTAIGVVALGAGTATLVMSSKRTNELADLSSSNIAHTSTGFPSGDWDCRVPGDPCVKDLDKQRRSLNAASYGLLIGGGVLAVTGITLIMLDRSKKKKSAAIIVPTAGPGYAGVAGSMRF